MNTKSHVAPHRIDVSANDDFEMIGVNALQSTLTVKLFRQTQCATFALIGRIGDQYLYKMRIEKPTKNTVDNADGFFISHMNYPSPHEYRTTRTLASIHNEWELLPVQWVPLLHRTSNHDAYMKIMGLPER